MIKEIAQSIDPFQESLNYLLVIVFSKSSSKNFNLALNLARGAERFAEIVIDGKPVYFVCLGKNLADAGRSVALMDYISQWKGTQIFSNGLLVNYTHDTTQVLRCYLGSKSSNSENAYCINVIDDPFLNYERPSGFGMFISVVEFAKPYLKHTVEIGQYSFPCNYIFHNFTFQQLHPESVPDQIQACAVKRGCHWCPNFKPDNFKKVGVRKEIRNFFD